MARPKGSTNARSIELKQMILLALNSAGGQEYLTRQAKENPTAFLTLIGKVLPLSVSGNMNGKLVVSWEN